MVKRYEPDDLEIIGMRRDDDGDYVDYSDYADLEQRCKELEETNLNNVAMADYQIAELKDGIALLRKRLEPIEAAYKEYKEYPLSAIVKRDAYDKAINRCMEIGQTK